LGKNFKEAWGIDIVPSYINTFKKELEVCNLKNIHLTLMYADRVAFSDGYFNIATAIEVLDYVIELEKTLAEVIRVLRPGGLFGITCPNQRFPFETHGFWWRGHKIRGKFPFYLLSYSP